MTRSTLLLFLAGVSAYSLAEGVTPVQKVVQLLQDMRAKGQSEKQEEQKRFSAYKQFCDDTSREKQRNIKEANNEMEQLSADIQKALSDATVLGREIAELDGEIAGWESNKKAATEVRTKEHQDYSMTHRDYSESVDALERAISVLKRQNFDRTQASSLLQQVSVMARVPESAKRVIASFLSTDNEVSQDPLSVSAPEANAYEFQSGGVIDMLEKLKDKFMDERNTLEKEEMNAKHSFEMLVQDLTDSIEAATSERGEKAKNKASLQEQAAEDKGDLAATTQSRDEDQKYLDTLVAQCDQKSQDFESRQQLRSEELEAIAKAIEIISSGAVAGNSEKHLPQLVQTSLAQFLASDSTVSPMQRNVAEFLQGRAEKLQSRILAQVAEKVQDDPFTKVKKMIKDMIVRLMEEANEEAEHKGWCDTELATNKQTREQKSEAVDMLTAEADKLTADVSKLTEQIADLADAIAEIDAAVAKATAVRSAEKEKNAETVKDAQDAQTAVGQALVVLKEFYAKAAEATALVQQNPEDDAPETFDTSYTGMQSESGGVVGMLEVIESDFARLEAETAAAEESASNEYDRFSAESSKDKAVKSTDMDHKSKSKTYKEANLQDTKKDLAGTQAELEAALAYYEKLKPSCVDAGVSYADRVQRRKDEIESLQEALKILSGEDI